MAEAGDNRSFFVALPVSPKIREQFTSLPRHPLAARWLHEDDLHITLRFLGNIEQDVLEEVKELLFRVKRPVFGLECGGMDIFDLKQQIVLWAAVQSTRKMTALTGDINEILASAGFEMPVKPYIPHITLARLKRQAALAGYMKRYGAHMSDSWQVREFALMGSNHHENGSKYSILERYPLLGR